VGRDVRDRRTCGQRYSLRHSRIERQSSKSMSSLDVQEYHTLVPQPVKKPAAMVARTGVSVKDQDGYSGSIVGARRAMVATPNTIPAITERSGRVGWVKLRRRIPDAPNTLPLLKRSKEVALCMSSAPRVVSTGVNMVVINSREDEG
jgi:hypothetical protein